LFQFGTTGSSGAIDSGNVDYDNFYANTPDNYTVNGKRVTGVLVSANGAVVNRLVASALPNLTPCQCDYTRWGFWLVDSTDPNTDFKVYTGRPVGSPSDVPTTGTATYTGHVVADVSSAGFVAGGFSNSVNFGARTGAVSVTGLDNTSYTGNVNFNTDPRNFGGTINSTTFANDGRQMALQGSFFQGKTSPVGEMGGSVAISSTKDNYLGSGIFAASKR
jgi:hypothetical protein